MSVDNFLWWVCVLFWVWFVVDFIVSFTAAHFWYEGRNDARDGKDVQDPAGRSYLQGYTAYMQAKNEYRKSKEGSIL